MVVNALFTGALSVLGERAIHSRPPQATVPSYACPVRCLSMKSYEGRKESYNRER